MDVQSHMTRHTGGDENQLSEDSYSMIVIVKNNELAADSNMATSENEPVPKFLAVRAVPSGPLSSRLQIAPASSRATLLSCSLRRLPMTIWNLQRRVEEMT